MKVSATVVATTTFAADGRPVQSAHTLRQFVEMLEASPPGSLEVHFDNHDFSRWIQDVFGDYPLASTVRQIEDRHRVDVEANGVAAVTQAVRARYEFVDPLGA